MVLQIAIVGAGIGGLALAALLARQGHSVTLAERFARPMPVGSGLVVQPGGLAVLTAIGAGPAARALAAPIRMMSGMAGRREVLHVRYRPQTPGLAIHRASLFAVLWQAALAAGLETATGAAVIAAPLVGEKRYLQRDGAADLGPFDLVIDASGAGSLLSPMQARPLAFGAIWTSVPWPEASVLRRDQLTQRYFRAERMAGVMPIGCLPDDPTPRAALFWSLPRHKLDQWGASEFDGWRAEALAFWPALAPFLAQLGAAADMAVARYSHGSLAKVHASAMAFIGDAAHRTSPQLGQGANMALIDAMALAMALRDLPIAQALPRYSQMRRWHRWLYQTSSALLTPMYQSHSRALPVIRDLALAPLGLVPPVRQILTSLVTGDIIPQIAGTAWPDF